MPTLLHLDVSPSFSTSISRTLSAAFVERWQEQHPDGILIRRDLAKLTIPTVNQEWIAAAFTPAPDRTLEQKRILELSDELIEELKKADLYVFGVPMYNFAPPAALKLWLDQVVRVGETYQNVAGKREGLLSAKQVVIFVASGGTYEAESPTAPFDFITPYLRAILSYIGLNAVRFHSAGGTKILLGKTTTREAFLAPHLDEIRSGMSS